MLTPWKESYDQPRQHMKKQRHYFANKCPSSQGYGFPSGHVWIGSWSIKKLSIELMLLNCVLEKILESPFDCKEIQPVDSKADRSWVFIERTEVEAETRILWPPMWRDDSFEKTLMLGNIECRRKRGWQRMRWLNVITDSLEMGLAGILEMVMDREAWSAVVRGVAKSWTRLSD